MSITKTISYAPLWKTLIDKGLKKTDLISMANMGSGTLAKLSKNQEISMTVLLKLCTVLNCELTDIMIISWKGSKWLTKNLLKV